MIDGPAGTGYAGTMTTGTPWTPEHGPTRGSTLYQLIDERMPHRDKLATCLRRWRRQGMGYDAIATMILGATNVQVSKNTVRRWVVDLPRTV